MKNRPTIGRIVHVVGPSAASNGADAAPAVITRVWSDRTVNVTLFPDAAVPAVASSVPLFEDEEDARAMLPSYAAFWPSKH